MDLSIITDPEEERDALRAEAEKDYEDMRRFQKAYIEADQECRHLRAEVERLRGEVEESACLYRGVRDEGVKSRTDLTKSVELIKDFILGANHTRIFLRSREKMNPTGVELYDKWIEECRAFLARMEVKP